jgi:hypothetical protein
LGGVSVDMIRLREPPPLFAVSTAIFSVLYDFPPLFRGQVNRAGSRVPQPTF